MENSKDNPFAPFVLRDGTSPFLALSDSDMLARVDVFNQRSQEGWNGNGYDWTAIAHVVVQEKLPDLVKTIEFDPEAGMFAAYGSLDSLEWLGAELKKAFDDPDILRDLLSRAELE